MSKVTSIDHELATSPKVPAEAHTKGNTGKQSTVHHYYYGATQDQEGITDTATRYGSIVENDY